LDPIRIKEKSRELWRHTKEPWRLILEPWRLTMDPTRLTVELWNVLRPEVANSHHFDEDPDSYLQVCNQLKGGSGSVSK
jgi:hypothetical protein